ncbi:winged helix-turn-helix domain-containing protein [Paenibacillus mendelii]|uniref:Winged helix-turn-helix domain-containing protein n=1 Tax=Paenibacillus mendelii TaxID=206163 RepID=A0ABV6JD82_9BACL|nr:transcriptional regulator [Paenibacillus mendelii]MCQ6562394.1 transcriptional regulator [Paenibacillus mendelii]
MNENIFDAIDETIHAKARLGIMSLLTVHQQCDFGFLRNELGLTEGNLGSHIRVLEQAGYIDVAKTFAGKRPRTTCSATQLGRSMFQRYIEGLEKIIRMAQLPPKQE